MTNNLNLVELINNKPLTTSLKVAEVFNKEHKNILQSVEKLECSENFRLANFSADVYLDAYGREQKQFTITRDGFTFLAMGFTGKKAAQFKEAYINAFNQMEEALRKTGEYALKIQNPQTPDQSLIQNSQTKLCCCHNKYNYIKPDDIPQELSNLEIARIDLNYDKDNLCYWCPVICDCECCPTPVHLQSMQKVGLYIHIIFEKMIRSEIDKDYKQYNLLNKVIIDLIKTNRKIDWDNYINSFFLDKTCELAFLGYKTKYGYKDDNLEDAKRRLCLA
jgi:Rha family phage regulatory protein